MPKPDYSHWLTKQQAADAIGCSTKTIEKLAAEKQIQKGSWKRPETGATVAMYHPDDVNRIRLERNPGAEPFVVAPLDMPAAALALVPPSSWAKMRELSEPAPPPFEQLASLLATALTGSQSSQNGHVRTAERLFLTLSEAADYSGLPQVHLRRLMKDQKLAGLKTGSGWRIRRADLEKL